MQGKGRSGPKDPFRFKRLNASVIESPMNFIPDALLFSKAELVKRAITR
jgi:hypothetical protein